MNKYYVVWRGRKTGIFSNWEDCKKQIHKFQGASYKSFKNWAEAEKQFEKGINRNSTNGSFLKGRKKAKKDRCELPSLPLPEEAICVDGAFGKNGMEFRAVHYPSGVEMFRYGPFQGGSNNIAEFLALCEAVNRVHYGKLGLPVYSDSQIAISWLTRGKANPFHHTIIIPEVQEWIDDYENWLEKIYQVVVVVVVKRWQTKYWGENPADFGRKKN